MTFVRGADGQPLLCMWDDCEQPGHEEIKVIRTEGKKELHYVFCHPRHRDYYTNAHRSHGNLSPTGPRVSPLGLILP